MGNEYEGITLNNKDANAARNKALDSDYDRELKERLAKETRETVKKDSNKAYEKALSTLNDKIAVEEAYIQSIEADMKKAAEIVKNNPGLAAKEEELRRPHSNERVKHIIEAERLKEERDELVREHAKRVGTSTDTLQ